MQMYNLILLVILISLINIVFFSKKGFSILLYWILLVLITVSMGIRFNVGLDYMTYFYTFRDSYDWFTYEPIYAMAQYLFRVTLRDFGVFTFFISITTMTFIHLSIINSTEDNNNRLLNLVIFSSTFYFTFMNLMRTGLSASILMFAFSYRFGINKGNKEKKIYLFYLLILVSGLIHYSVFFIAPILLILTRFRIKSRTFLILFAVTILFVKLGIIPSITKFVIQYFPRYSHYIHLPGVFGVNGPIFSVAIILEFLFLYTYLMGRKEKNEFKQDLVSIPSAGLLIKQLSLSTFLLNRVSIFLNLFILTLDFRSVDRSKRKTRLIFTVVMVVFILFNFTGNAYRNLESTNLRYESIFNEEYKKLMEGPK